MAVLVVADHDNSEVKPATASVVTAALAIDSEVHVLVAGSGCAGVAEAAAGIKGVAKVLLADAPHYAEFLAEPMAALLVSLADGYGAVLAVANTDGKNFMPRLAALKDVSQISEIVEVQSADTFVRPIYAGNAMATVQSSDALKVITVRTTTFAKAEMSGGSANVESIDGAGDPGISSFVAEAQRDGRFGGLFRLPHRRRGNRRPRLLTEPRIPLETPGAPTGTRHSRARRERRPRPHTPMLFRR